MALKILIGTPTASQYKYCLDRYIHALRSQTVECDILLVDNSEDESYPEELKQLGIKVLHVPREGSTMEILTKCRNLMCDYAEQNGYDFLFFVDQDTIAPPDALEKLLSVGEDIVSGVVFNMFIKEGRQLKLPALWTWLKDDEFKQVLANPHEYPSIVAMINKYGIKSSSLLRRQITPEEISEPKVIEVKFCGAACLLVSRAAFSKARFNLKSVTGHPTGEDVAFCRDAREKGFRIFANTAVVCDHLVEDKPAGIFDE